MRKKLRNLLFVLPFAALASTSLSFNTSENLYEERDKELIVFLEKEANPLNFFCELNGVTTNYKVVETYTSDLYGHGYLLEVNNEYLDEIDSLNTVIVTSENKTYEVDEQLDNYNSYTVYTDPLTNNSTSDMNVPSSSDSKLGEGTVIAVLDSSFSPAHESFQPLTGSAAENAKLSEEEVNAFIAEKGLDYGSYYNNKIPYYGDYANTDKDTESLTSTHGMHVSSVAAANGEFKGVAPNAQLVFMKIFSDSGNTQMFSESAVIRALTDCYELGVDVINMSFGSDLSEFLPSGIDYLLTLLTEAGISSNIAAGNSGKGNFLSSGVYQYHTTDMIETGYLGNYAASEAGTTVAASNLISDNSVESSVAVLEVTGADLTNSENVLDYGSTLSGTDQLIDYVYENNDGNNSEYDVEQPFSNFVDDPEAIAISEQYGGTHTDTYIDLPYIVIPGLGAEEGETPSEGSAILNNDYAELDQLTPNPVEGKIAVIRRGEFNFAKKVMNAVERGAIGVIIYNYEGSGDAGRMDLNDLPASMQVPIYYVSQDDGAMLTEKAIGDYNTGMLRISQRQIANFSTDGATADLRMKVEITAPGENIAGAINVQEGRYNDTDHGLGYTEIPVNQREITHDSYMYMSGTSMAAPNYSGAYAVALSDLKTSLNATTSEDELALKKNMKTRIMSTADVLFDANGAPVSTRRQGAGQVDVSNAINSPIYLSAATPKEVTNESTSGDSVTATYYDGKIELGTTTQNGLIDFDYLIHNEEGLSGVTLNASLYITVPELLVTDTAGDSFQDFEGTKFQSIYQSVVDKVTLEPVTLTGEETQTTSVNYQIPQGTIDEIMANYEDGIYLEGFVVLESATGETTEDIHVNLPYLGFLGDYSKGSAIEEFNFEKEEGKIYPSALLNNALEVTGVNLPNGNFESLINVGSDITNATISSFLNNTADPNEVLLPIHGEEIDGTYHIYAGATDIADELYIQTFVKRSVLSNSYKITAEGSSTPLITGSLSDSISFGGTALARTLATSDLFTTGEIAHRGYTRVDLSSLSDGTYNFDFTFELGAGFTQTKHYVLHLEKDNTLPTVDSYSYYYDANTIDISFTSSIYTLTANGISATRVGDTLDTFTIQMPDDLEYNDSVTFNVESNNYYTLLGVTSLDDDRVATLWNGNVGNGYSIELDISEFSGFDSGIANLYTVYLYNASGNAVNEVGSGLNITIKLDEVYANSDIEVYSYSTTGLKRITNFTKDGQFLSLLSDSDQFIVRTTSGGGDNGPVDSTTWIIVGSVIGGVVVLGGVGVGLYLLIRKNKKNVA